MANEVGMRCRRPVSGHDEGCEAIGVVVRGQRASAGRRARGRGLAAAVAALQQALPEPMPAGFVSELRLGQDEWLQATAALTRGALLVIDYGLPRAQYYHASRDGGTLADSGGTGASRIRSPRRAPRT